MACGCGDRCTCSIVAGDNISVTGSGDNFDPYVITGVETLFEATTADNSIQVTPAGVSGHSPDIAARLSGDAGNIIEKHVDGLFVGTASAVAAARIVGELIDFTGIGTPGLCLEADGGSHLVSAYPSLAVVYGATGVGDGLYDDHPDLGLPTAGRFRVPDLRGRATYGRSGGTGDPALQNQGEDGTANGTGTGSHDSSAVAARTPLHTHTIAHTHTTPVHTHDYTPSGTNAAVTSGIISDNVTDANQFHTGFILRDIGANALCVDVDVNPIDETFFAPSLAAGCDGSTKDHFAKGAHTHNVPGQVFTGTAANTGNGTSGGNTGASSAANSGSGNIPYFVVRKVVFAGS